MLHEQVSLKRPAHILVLLVMGGILLGIPMCAFLAYRERAPRVEAWGENLATEALGAVKRPAREPAKAAPRAVSAQEATSSPAEAPRAVKLPAKAAPEQDTLTAADVARIDKAVEAEHRQWEIDNRAILEADEAEIRAADEFMARMRAPMPEPTQEELAAAQEAALQRALARGLQEEYEDITR